jgi:hypothetical protein
MSKKLPLGEFMDKLSAGLQERAEAFSAKCDELAAKEKMSKSDKESSAGAEKKKPKGNEAFTLAWQKYKKDKPGVKKDDGMDDMAMSLEKKHELSAGTKEKHPSIADSYEETPTPHPSAKPDDKTKMGKKKELMRKFEAKMAKKALSPDAKAWAGSAKGTKDAAGPSIKTLGKAEKCAKCGKSPCICIKKDEDLIDTAKSNIPGKQLKRFGGEKTVIPSDKAPVEIPAPGSGGKPEPMKGTAKLEKADLKPGHSFSLSPVAEKQPAPAKHEQAGEGKAGGELKPGHEIALSPVAHLKAPPPEKRVGMVQRIHQAAKAKMGMGKAEPSMKKDQVNGTMPKAPPVTPVGPATGGEDIKSPVLKSEMKKEESSSAEKSKK